MKHLIRLTQYSKDDISNIFKIADELKHGKYIGSLTGKTIVMFFPNSSIRSRVTFQRGVYLLGGQVIVFSPDTLEKREETKDVMGYLANWADAVIIRHKDISLLEKIAECSSIPVINAMTDENHPCEVLTDLYALSKLRNNYLKDHYLFVGAKGNIGLAWKEAAEVLEFSFTQCCSKGFEMDQVPVIYDIEKAMYDMDIICTDSLSEQEKKHIKDYQITVERMELANEHAILNPCPPFYRDDEVDSKVIDSPYFVGYDFKKYLVEVQQAILLYSLIVNE